MPKKNRLTRKAFEALPRARGRRFHGTYFSLTAAPLEAGAVSQTACIVSKKVSMSAVTRNLVKRRCRAALAPLLRAAAPLTLVYTAKREAATASYRGIADDVRALFERAHKQGTMPQS